MDASVAKRAPEVATCVDIETLKTESTEAAALTMKIVKEGCERNASIFSDQVSELRDTLSKSLFQHVETLLKDYDCLIGSRMEETERDILELKGFASVSPDPSPPCAEPVKLCTALRDDDVHGPFFSQEDVPALIVPRRDDSGAVASMFRADRDDLEPLVAPFSGGFVRLDGLKTVGLNDKIGTITDCAQPSGRIAVLLHGESQARAFKASNLVEYKFAPTDICETCHEEINLSAFPPCSDKCVPHVRNEREGDRHSARMSNLPR